jgi:hypothetical protein
LLRSGVLGLGLLFGLFSGGLPAVASRGGGFGLRLGALIAGFTDEVNNYFLLFLAVTRIAQSLARYGE